MRRRIFMCHVGKIYSKYYYERNRAIDRRFQLLDMRAVRCGGATWRRGRSRSWWSEYCQSECHHGSSIEVDGNQCLRNDARFGERQESALRVAESRRISTFFGSEDYHWHLREDFSDTQRLANHEPSTLQGSNESNTAMNCKESWLQAVMGALTRYLPFHGFATFPAKSTVFLSTPSTWELD